MENSLVYVQKKINLFLFQFVENLQYKLKIQHSIIFSRKLKQMSIQRNRLRISHVKRKNASEMSSWKIQRRI